MPECLKNAGGHCPESCIKSPKKRWATPSAGQSSSGRGGLALASSIRRTTRLGWLRSVIKQNSNKCWFYKQATRDRRSTRAESRGVHRSPVDGLEIALGGLFFPSRFRYRFCLRFLLLFSSQIDPRNSQKSKKTDFLRSFLLD